jgi:DNA polymerase-1
MLTLIQNRIGEVADLPRETDLFGESKANINLNSTQQVQAMFESLGFTVTLKGEKTTNKIALAAFLDANPGFKYASVIEDVITWRQWSHMVSGAYAKEVQSDGKIHCQWNQVEADTGRFSCSKPNLQNVERPRPERPNLRHLFLPEDDDHTFLIADYNQQEPRVFAQISGDVNLRRACSESDVYIGMVKQIFGIDVKKGDKKRDDAKTGVLADLYGAQPATLASRLKCSMAEAEAFHAKITEQFRDARRWSTRTIDSAKNTGQVRTLLGRIRYFPEAQIYKKISPHLANQFVNTPIQGSGADMLKLALDKFGAVCEEHDYPAYPSMVVHDEIVVQCRKDFAEEVYYQLVGSMEEAGSELCPDVKIIADGTISPRWDKT